MASSSADNDARAYNDYVSAAVELSGGHISDTGTFTVTRSVRDIDNNKRRKYLYTIASPGTNSQFIAPPVELHNSIQWRLPSPSGAKIAILRHDEDCSDADSDAQVLEIWQDYGQELDRRIRLPKDLHGKVIYDEGGFGTPSWNAQETVIAYAAERRKIETVSFFSAEKDDKKVRGAQYELGIGRSERWGEKYHKQEPLLDLFCVNVETGKVGIVENVPRDQDNGQTTNGGYTLGQPVFSPDSEKLVYVAWDAGGGKEMPRRLGLIYCQQRPSKIYCSAVEKLLSRLANSCGSANETERTDEGYEALSSTFRLARSPRFAPVDQDSTDLTMLVFLGSKEGFATHSGCLGLFSLKWGENNENANQPEMIVNEVWDPRESSDDCGCVSGMKFPGLYTLELPKYCFVSPNYLVMTSQWGSTAKIVRVNLDKRTAELVPCGDEMGSSILIGVSKSGDAIIQKTTPTDPGVLSFVARKELLVEHMSRGSLSDRDLTRFKRISSTTFSPSRDFTYGFSYEVIGCDAPCIDGVAFDLPIQSLLLLPLKTRADGTKPPLIVVPHGGPHSVSSSRFLPSYAYLCGHGGYALLFVNYRGSTGFGQGSIQSLPTFVGELDVNDVVAATRDVVRRGIVDGERVGICGGSHGGFLVGHCTGQFPDLFKAAAARNPVVNIPSMTTTTDIPDWCYAETLGTYEWSGYRPPTQDELCTMREKSPVRYLEHVRAPTLVALGLNDLRVPPSQGFEWFHSLRSKMVPCKLLEYETEDHALGGVQSEADHWLNTKMWFDRFM